MTNQLVGDVYAKIIEEVVEASKADFEENGVSSLTLQELQQEWQTKLSGKSVAQMPWDPKPVPTPAPVQQSPNPSASLPSATTNGMTSSAYAYDIPSNGSRVKTESGAEPQYPSNRYPQNAAPTQGGLARAQQLAQQYGGGQAATAAANAVQRGGLALPGQQARPQGLQLPGQNAQQMQQYAQQQQQQAYRQQQSLQQQQVQPRIKVESDSPQVDQSQFQQQSRQTPAAYAQTDGADEGLEAWQAMLAQRRAISAEQTQRADRMIREHIMQMSSDLQSGLMVPLGEQPKRSGHKKRKALPQPREMTPVSGPSALPQLDGAIDDDEKPDIKDEDDENAINSDLDDSDEEGQGPMGDEDDDMGDSILCTYDKVQRVKNKWKCTLKDGVMSVKGKEWVFHKGMGEFEW